MHIRILTAIILTIGAFIAPWWSVALGMAICAVAYRIFLEALVPAIVIDVLYAAQPVFGVPGLLTVAIALIIMTSLFSEDHIRGHVRI